MSHGIVARYPVTRTPPRRWSWRKLLRGECEGCQSATLSPDICIEAQRNYDDRTEPPLRSGFVRRPPATLKKRSPINPGTSCWECAPQNFASICPSVRGRQCLNGTKGRRNPARREVKSVPTGVSKMKNQTLSTILVLSTFVALAASSGAYAQLGSDDCASPTPISGGGQFQYQLGPATTSGQGNVVMCSPGQSFLSHDV